MPEILLKGCSAGIRRCTVDRRARAQLPVGPFQKVAEKEGLVSALPNSWNSSLPEPGKTQRAAKGKPITELFSCRSLLAELICGCRITKSRRLVQITARVEA